MGGLQGNWRLAAVAGVVLTGSATGARVRAEGVASAHLYGQGLVARTLARHRGVSDIRLYPGVPSPPDGGDRTRSLSRPLNDSMGAPIGSVEVTFASSRVVSGPEADAVARELGRHVYLMSNLADPEPFAGMPPLDTYAQALVDAAVMRDDELVTLAMHLAPPGGGGNIILASNFGRIGKPGDADDAAVQATGKPVQEVTHGGRRLAVELPLLDAHGAAIGALSTSFRLSGPDRRPAVYARAVALRDELARDIPSLQRLWAPATPSTKAK